MPEDIFAQKLDWFKKNEKPEVVLCVDDDSGLIKIIVAWTNTTVLQNENLSALTTEMENAAWEWLWENTHFSRAELLEKSGCAEFGFDREFKKLVGNRILYPDGTVNSFVQRYLREKVLCLFETKGKKRPTANRGT